MGFQIKAPIPSSLTSFLLVTIIILTGFVISLYHVSCNINLEVHISELGELLDSPCFLLVFLPFSFIWVLYLLKGMLEIFFIGLDNFILLSYMWWGSRWRNWKSKICLFFTIKASLPLLLLRMYSFRVHSVRCKELGDLGSFCQKIWADSLTYISSDPLVQWVISWKKHELLLVIIMPSPFLECLWRHKASAISVIKNSFVCNFCYCIQLVHSRESFYPKMMAFFL